MNQEKKLRINNNSKSLSNNTSRINTIANTNNKQQKNNYILNSDFPHNSKSIIKQNNYILNNPKLFFTETEVLKTDRNLIKKRNQKKDIIKSMMNQAINSSPSYTKSKAIFDRNSKRDLVIINEANLRTISQSRNNKQYFSNKNINKTPKKILINEYNFKNNPELINKGNSTNKYKNYNYGI